MDNNTDKLKIYGIYLISNKNNLEIASVCPKKLDEIAIPYLSTLLSVVSQDILKKDMGEEVVIEIGTDLFHYFSGEEITIVAHTEKKKSVEFNNHCKNICIEIEKKFPVLKNWNGEKIPTLNDYLQENFFEKKFASFLPTKEIFSLENQIYENPCENVDTIESANYLYITRAEFQKSRIFLTRCIDKMEKQHKDCYHVPRLYSLLGWTFNYLFEFEMAYNYFDRALNTAYNYKEDALNWSDNENLKFEKNERIKNSSIALADAYRGLTRIHLVKNDFLKAEDCLISAKEEIKYLEGMSKELREIDIELAHAIILNHQQLELEKELTETEEKLDRIFIERKIKKIINESENIYNNLEMNIENKIKNTEDEILKNFYKEKQIKMYGNWGVWLSERNGLFNEEFNKMAIKKYELAFRIINEIGLKRHLGMISNNTAKSYAIIKDFDKGRVYFEILKKEAETNKALRTRCKICEVWYNVFYYTFEEKNAVKIKEAITEINRIIEEEKDVDEDDKIKLNNLKRKAEEFLNEISN